MTRSGIYKIINTINRFCYIGSAVDISKRKVVHFRTLNSNKSACKKLQNAFNKYGESAFTFEVIELVEDKSKLIEREQYYLDTLKPEYNISKIAGNCYDISKTLKNKYQIQRGNRFGCIPWNKGLTKEINEIIALSSKKVSENKKQKFKSGELKSWNEGLTKHTDNRLLSASKKISKIKKEGYAIGKLIVSDNFKYNRRKIK